MNIRAFMGWILFSVKYRKFADVVSCEKRSQNMSFNSVVLKEFQVGENSFREKLNCQEGSLFL